MPQVLDWVQEHVVLHSGWSNETQATEANHRKRYNLGDRPNNCLCLHIEVLYAWGDAREALRRSLNS